LTDFSIYDSTIWEVEDMVEVIQYLASLTYNEEAFWQSKAILIDWAKLHNVDLTAADILRLRSNI